MYRKSYDDNISFRKHVQKLCANIVFASYDFPKKKIRRKNFSKKGMESAVGRSRASWASGRARGIAWPCVCGPWLTWPAAPAFKLCLVLKIFIGYSNFERLITN